MVAVDVFCEAVEDGDGSAILAVLVVVVVLVVVAVVVAVVLVVVVMKRGVGFRFFKNVTQRAEGAFRRSLFKLVAFYHLEIKLQFS